MSMISWKDRLCSREAVARTSERYGLPPVRLSAAAKRALLAHEWPGNVRELENALDRAALLSRDGLIEALPLADGRPAGSDLAGSRVGVIARLQQAAEALVEAMVRRPELRDLDAGRALQGAILLALARRLGSREAAFALLGRQDQIRSRNHHRTWAREVGRLDALAAALGESVVREG